MSQQQISSSIDAEQGLAPNASAPLRLRRIKRLDRPNKAAHFQQIGDLQAQIDSLQQRIMEVKEILDKRSQTRHVGSPELIAARKKLSDLNAAFKEAVERKRAHREELELVNEKLRGSSNRSRLPDVTVEQLDEQIRKLEYRQTHTTLAIDEERKLVLQIEKLKKSRDSLCRHDSRAEQDQGSRTELVDLLRKADLELDALKVEQQQQRQVINDIREKESALAIDIPALLEEKSGAYETIRGLRDDIKQLKVEFSVNEDEYWKREREWQEQQVLERKMRAEKGRAEWLEREKIRKQRTMENFVEPYTNEIIMCEQLLCYMQKNAPLDEGAATPQQQQKSEVVAPQGFGVIISKKNRNEDELDGWFAGSGGKKGKKVKGSAPPKSKVREKISLSIDALSSFGKLKLSAPATYGDVTKSIEELKLKKDQFVEMQKKARELREKGGGYGVDAVDVAVSQSSGEEASWAKPSAEIENNGVIGVIENDDGRLGEEVSLAQSSVQVEDNGVDAASKNDDGRLAANENDGGPSGEEASLARFSAQVKDNGVDGVSENDDCRLAVSENSDGSPGEEASLAQSSAQVEDNGVNNVCENDDCRLAVVENGDGSSGEEALLAQSSAQVEDNGVNCVSENDDGSLGVDGGSLVAEAGRGVLPMDESSSLGQGRQGEVSISKFVKDTTDNKDNGELDDKAHLETFEFSEAHLHTEEDAHIEEQVAENGVASVIFECAAQNGSLKELSGENLKIEERVAQFVGNGVYSQTPESETVNDDFEAIPEETPQNFKGCESVVSNAENGDTDISNGVLQVGETDPPVAQCKEFPAGEEQVMLADFAEGKVLANEVNGEHSPLLA